MTLFQVGDFTLHSGQRSKWKIDCDALTDADWEGLAAMAAPLLSAFGAVEGIPSGGLRFAAALRKWKGALDFIPRPLPTLIADDVLTTGESMEAAKADQLAKWPQTPVSGVVAFARGPVPDWVTPLFMTKAAVDSYCATHHLCGCVACEKARDA